MTDGFTVRRLGAGDEAAVAAMNAVFAAAFEDAERYGDAPPGAEYVAGLLADPQRVALVATEGDRVIGALTAYELQKFEREISEFYLYDLGVDAAFRRRGVATALIHALGRIAQAKGGAVVFVQADLEDAPAIALYATLGVRADVLHFDLAPPPS